MFERKCNTTDINTHNTVHHKRTSERFIEKDWRVAESTSGGSSGLGGN